MSMARFILLDRAENVVGDLGEQLVSCVSTEEINGEHKLEIATTQVLHEGMRILYRDGTGRWREWVVDDDDRLHEGAARTVGTYGCTWSVQYDLATVYGDELWPGTYDPISANAALAMVLAKQSRWEVGNVTVTATAGTSLYDGSVWEYLSKLVETWGGEVEPRIEVSSAGVVHRYVDWLAHVGSVEVRRRFDYGEDCTSIRQKVDPGPRYCRIVPRGGRDATDEDGVSYSERVGVEEEPYSSGDGWVHDAGSIWIRDPDAELDFRQPDGNGGWHYPEKVVTYDSDDPEELVWLASADIHNHTRPKATYEASVLQFAQAGMDAHGVELGDEVHVVDRTFGEAPLRLQARIVKMTVNELDPTDTELTIGELGRDMTYELKSVGKAIESAEDRSRRIEGGGTIVRVQTLLDQLNAEINATGGYSYAVTGEGTVTYDIAVDDPSVGYNSALGRYASQVVQIKGGTMRFANTKKAQFAGIGDWNWTNVITADGYLALAATIARLTTGYIGSVESGNYWNLDTGELRMAAVSTTVGDQTLAQYIGDNLGLNQTKVFNLLTDDGTVQGLYMLGSQLYVNGSYIKGGTIVAGGSDNVNGVIQVLDASGTEVCRLDNDGAIIVGRVTMRADCNILNGSTSTYDRKAETTIGVLSFTDGDIFQNLVGTNLSSSSFNLPGLRITGANANNGSTVGFIQIIPPIYGSYKRSSIYSESPIYMFSTDANTTKGAGMYLQGGSSGINGRGANTYVKVFNSDTTSSEHVDISAYTVNIGTSTSGYTVNVKAPSTFTQNVSMSRNLTVTGTKSRAASTDNYSDRLLYCYETPSPLFGDVGSGVIGEDGTCVVAIDDVFAECARTDMAYQVFLQKGGQGDLWVSEKTPTHFIVEGTPGLPFDWEVKAHQTGYETERLENVAVRDESDVMGMEDTDAEDAYADGQEPDYMEWAYEDELSYADGIESLYEEAA